MKKYEYKIALLEYGWAERFGPIYGDVKEVRKTHSKALVYFKQMLNELGKEGWEYVECLAPGFTYEDEFSVLLKREAEEKEAEPTLQNPSIRVLPRERIIHVYNHLMPKHFPENEIRPLDGILEMYDRGEYFGLGTFAEIDGTDKPVSYGLFAHENGGDFMLLDYFATTEEYRGMGMGSYFMKYLAGLGNVKGVFVETEDIDYVTTPQDYQKCKEREAFYRRNGCVKTSVRETVFGVPFSIWYLKTGEDVSDKEVLEGMQKLYQMMLPEEVYKEKVQIYRV